LIPALNFLGTQREGILVLLLVLIVLGAVLNWVLWMFGWGRFQGSPGADSKIRYVLANFFVKIIDDFRNLLALVMVALFAVALFVAMWPGIAKQDVTLIKEGLQGVAAALSGLIGSIVGYYFGESAAKKRAPGGNAPPPPVIEQAPSEAGIKIPKPPTAGKQGENIK
jgi:hypothetical protein